jgi:molybdopterin-guanine dinucleotide biosynthesis protein MobB
MNEQKKTAESSVPLLSVVGVSNSGKSTLLVKLVKVLKDRGYRVGIIKHSCGFEVDKPGKDSWCYQEVGAGPVVLAGPRQMISFKSWETELTPEEIARNFDGVDLVLTEGYKLGKRPKIEVFRQQVSDDLICKPEELLAVVSDTRRDWGIPVFDLEDIAGLADFVENRFLRITGSDD